MSSEHISDAQKFRDLWGSLTESKVSNSKEEKLWEELWEKLRRINQHKGIRPVSWGVFPYEASRYLLYVARARRKGVVTRTHPSLDSIFSWMEECLTLLHPHWWKLVDVANVPRDFERQLIDFLWNMNKIYTLAHYVERKELRRIDDSFWHWLAAVLSYAYVLPEPEDEKNGGRGTSQHDDNPIGLLETHQRTGGGGAPSPLSPQIDLGSVNDSCKWSGILKDNERLNQIQSEYIKKLEEYNSLEKYTQPFRSRVENLRKELNTLAEKLDKEEQKVLEMASRTRDANKWTSFTTNLLDKRQLALMDNLSS